MLDTVLQAIIAISSGLTIWLLVRKDKWYRWGFVTGLISEPFWLWSAIRHDQWAIILLVAWYTYAYALGFKNYWRTKK